MRTVLFCLKYKFQYLLQAVVRKSNAARVVKSFPATADNYPKAIVQLKDRFGREDLLVQIYVRDFSMVMKNAIFGRATADLPALYDELKFKIRALDSLDRTQEKYEKAGNKTKTYFLPHRPVVANDGITTKIRPVFDTSAREIGKSLNQLLYTGPNLIAQISDIIDKFRSYPIGISADIEKAFLQLEIASEHRGFLSFFYPKEDEQIIYRYCRVVFLVSSSPFLLASDLTPIIPAMFLCDNPAFETTDLDVLDGNHLRKRLRFRAKMIQVLGERFRKEYLGQLIQRHRQHPQSHNIQIGDIVLIGDVVKSVLNETKDFLDDVPGDIW
ncbi:hypothetical protein HNY73_022207 [Argiope bruennichi]|uniref:DUF5641 domain-containing protein n=1 Tax=Argiope bruennichi TaxID=94029 RepID=A0A8T0E1G3_ARGBR|nr:hypothetical protein HNY73_022207 [Argiope bruennichi]